VLQIPSVCSDSVSYGQIFILKEETNSTGGVLGSRFQNTSVSSLFDFDFDSVPSKGLESQVSQTLMQGVTKRRLLSLG
jgi:hypothetical protein